MKSASAVCVIYVYKNTCIDIQYSPQNDYKDWILATQHKIMYKINGERCIHIQISRPRNPDFHLVAFTCALCTGNGLLDSNFGRDQPFVFIVVYITSYQVHELIIDV
jgi:hypothetical protein